MGCCAPQAALERQAHCVLLMAAQALKPTQLQLAKTALRAASESSAE